MMNSGFLCAGIVAYFIGSIPTGYLLARWYGVDDIRQHGSGNIGATNVARVLGKRFFLLVFLLDALKAYICLQLSVWWFHTTMIFMSVTPGVLLGNAFSVFLGFKGGKGVSTSLGVLGALNPPLLVVGIAVWTLVFWISAIAGAASVITFMTLPFYVWFMATGIPAYVAELVLYMSGIVIYLHRDNIRNLLRVARNSMHV